MNTFHELCGERDSVLVIIIQLISVLNIFCAMS